MPAAHRDICSVLLLGGLGLTGCLCGQTPPPGPETQTAEAAEATEFAALLERLVAPLQPALVQAAIRHPHVADSDAAQSLIANLTAQRGVAASQGLMQLTNHACPEVRVAALRGVAELGLRVAGAAECARNALSDFRPDVKLAAIAALGVVGESGDMVELLELLAAEDKAPQVAAFRALRTLTGVRIANDARPWTYWWNQTTKELGKRLDRAIQSLTDGAVEADVIDARMLLAQSAWFDVPKLEEAVRGWLASDEPRLHSEAYRLVAGARLGDLADVVASALQDELEPDVIQAGIDCVAALGIRNPRAADSQSAAKPPR